MTNDSETQQQCIHISTVYTSPHYTCTIDTQILQSRALYNSVDIKRIVLGNDSKNQYNDFFSKNKAVDAVDQAVDGLLFTERLPNQTLE